MELVEKRVAELGEALTANSRTITEDLLLPNTVWRVGRVAATIRLGDSNIITMHALQNH